VSSLGKAFAFFTGASIIGSFTQVIKGKITAVLLGTEGVGILNQLTSLWSLFSAVASLGFYNGMLRHLAPAWADGDRLLFRHHMSSNFLLQMGTALILSLGGCWFSDTLSALVFDDGGARAGLICLILLSVPVYIAGQTYRTMLNATRSVSAVVRARIGADVFSVLVLAVLIFPFGLKGAIMGYIGLHILYLGFTMFFTRKVLGEDILLPQVSYFEIAEIKKNISFGINGLIAVAVGILTTLVVSRCIISSGGSGSNGLFTMAMKVATVYLGGLSAAAGGYYFPTLSSAKSDVEMHAHMNKTLSMYLFVIPPIILVLMAGGELMMRLLFSAEFIPAAFLLILILPGDLFRITAETIGMALVVKKRLIISTSSYILWAIIYLVLVLLLLPKYGIVGVAMAYFLSQFFNAIQQITVGRFIIGYRFDHATLNTIMRGFGMVFAMAIMIWFEQPSWLNWIAAIFLFTVWAMMSWSNPDFQRGCFKILSKVGAKRLIS